jgi:hypothetical protein
LTLAKQMGHCLRTLGLKHVRGLSNSGLVAALPHLVVMEVLEVMTVSAAGAGPSANTNAASNSSSLTLGGLWDALSVRSRRSEAYKSPGSSSSSSTTTSSRGGGGGGDSSSTDVLHTPGRANHDQHQRDQQSPPLQQQQQQRHCPRGTPDHTRRLPLPLPLRQLLWTCDAWTLELSSAARVQEELDKHLGQQRQET